MHGSELNNVSSHLTYIHRVRYQGMAHFLRKLKTVSNQTCHTSNFSVNTLNLFISRTTSSLAFPILHTTRLFY